MEILFKERIMNKIDEKILLLAILGVLTALDKENLTIEEAEKFLFSPKIVNKLRNMRCSEDIVELISKGCELEDIDSLIPEKLKYVITELVQDTLRLLADCTEFDKDFWIE